METKTPSPGVEAGAIDMAMTEEVQTNRWDPEEGGEKGRSTHSDTGHQKDRLETKRKGQGGKEKEKEKQWMLGEERGEQERRN